MSDNPVYDTLVIERAKYGATMSDNECAELMNTVAWIHRVEGWGLNSKTSGTHGTRYDGQGIAHDVLHHQPTNDMFDVLIGAGAQSTPTWNYLGKNQNSSRPWIAPIVPKTGGGEVPKPQPPKYPSYESLGGDATGNKIGNYLFYDYERAGQLPNPGMGIWFYRTSYDSTTGMKVEDAIAKHRAGWCSILGIPVDNKEF